MTLLDTSRRCATDRACLALVVVALAVAGCQSTVPSIGPVTLEPVAFSKHQWTGVAVSPEGRVFVNFPRWSDDVPISVAELIDGEPVAFPNSELNAWQPDRDPATHFVCVQAVFVDDRNQLWVLDPASPRFAGVVPGGPKLLQIDLATDAVVRTYAFDSEVAPADSYLNDVRIDTRRGFAFLSESGAGALVVLDLDSGEARRVLDDHPSTGAEPVTLVIGGQPWLRDGATPQVHADGIAYDVAIDRVYYQALTGRTLYSLPAEALRSFELPEADIAAQIEMVGKTGASDGLIAGADGKVYISALEKNAILRTNADGDLETVIQDDAIAWPDSFSFGPDGMLYFTTARIHEGASPRGSYGLYRLDVSGP